MVIIMYQKNLKMMRIENNYTQKKVAEIINVARSVYATYETEFVIIPMKHLIVLCNHFNVSLDYIFDLTQTKNYKNLEGNLNLKLAGERLKEFRKNNNLTQAKLATILKCSNTTIAGYERGRYLIATPFLYTICKKYNISADYLVGKVDKNIS